MTENKLKELYPYIEVDGLMFTARYNYTDIVAIKDEQEKIVDFEIQGFELLATPEQAYQEYLNPQQTPPDKNTILEARIDDLERTNANLLLEIAAIKGGV